MCLTPFLTFGKCTVYPYFPCNFSFFNHYFPDHRLLSHITIVKKWSVVRQKLILADALWPSYIPLKKLAERWIKQSSSCYKVPYATYRATGVAQEAFLSDTSKGSLTLSQTTNLGLSK